MIVLGVYGRSCGVNMGLGRQSNAADIVWARSYVYHPLTLFYPGPVWVCLHFVVCR